MRPLSTALFAAFLSQLPCSAQLVITQNQVPNILVANELMGPDISVSNIYFNGNPGSSMPSIGVGPSEIGQFNGSNTCIGLSNGVFLCTGVATVHLPGPNDELIQHGGGISPVQGYQTPDLDLSLLTGWPLAVPLGGTNIYNKAILEFDFVPLNDMVSFRYVFSSEEYERWACSSYNDVFGLFISGPGIPADINGPFTNGALNIAFVPGSMAPVCINAVNSGLLNANNANGYWTDPWGPCFEADSNWQANAQYYRYNGGQWTAIGVQGGPQLEAPYNTDPYYIQHNGMTVVLTASAAVRIGETYHIKIALSNVQDSQYHSAVWLEGNSLRASDRFSVTAMAGPNVDSTGDTIVLYQSNTDSVQLRFNRWGGFYLAEELSVLVEGDAVAGQDYSPALPTSFHLAQLDSAFKISLSVPVRADSSRQFTIHLTSDSGAVVRSFPLRIEPATGLGSGRVAVAQLSVFPNPADDAVNISFPSGMYGRVELQVLDASGRVVRERVLSAATRTNVELAGLPNGLYTVKAMANGIVATARVSVRH